MILKDLASFHAVPLALKLQKNETFEDKIKKNLNKPEFKPPEDEKSPSMNFDVWLDVLATRNHCKLYLPKLKDIFDDIVKNPKPYWGIRDKKEPFATICHGDLWVNNTMQVFKGTKMLKNKFLDFQMYTYDSPAQDLLFFIWTSVQFDVLKEHFDDLLKYYHDNFTEILFQLGCDVSPFSFDKFQDELKEATKYKIVNGITMTKTILAEKGKLAVDMLAEPGAEQTKKEDISEAVRDRCALILQLCGNRGWL